MSKATVKPTFSDIVDLVRQHYREAFGVEVGYAKAAEIVDEAIAPQKLAHADMVIGEDARSHATYCDLNLNYANMEDVVCSCEVVYQDTLRAEQRERNKL